MSAPPRVVLLDSCAYFRLARSIHPLLAESFGPAPPYSLFVLSALDSEYFTSSRLKHKFEWVNGPEYRRDRETKRYSCKGTWAPKAESAFSFLAGYAREQGLNVASEDLKALAAGFTRNITVVSDDRALRQVADAHGLTCMGTLDLLKIMVDCQRVTKDRVTEILEYLDHEEDLPMGKEALRKRYREIFGSDCPV